MNDIPMPSSVGIIVCSPTDSVAHIVSLEKDETYILDLSTSKIIQTIVSAKAIAFSPDGKKVYYNEGALVLVFHADNFGLKEIIYLDNAYAGTGLALLPDGSKAYVGGGGSDHTHENVAVIDAVNDKQISSISAPGSTYMRLQNISSRNDGNKVLIITFGSGISFLDTDTDTFDYAIFENELFSTITSNQAHPRSYAVTNGTYEGSIIPVIYVLDTTYTGEIVDLIHLENSDEYSSINISTDLDGFIYATDDKKNTITIFQDKSL